MGVASLVSVVLCVARGFNVLWLQGPLRAGGVPVKSERVRTNLLFFLPPHENTSVMQQPVAMLVTEATNRHKATSNICTVLYG